MKPYLIDPLADSWHERELIATSAEQDSALKKENDQLAVLEAALEQNTIKFKEYEKTMERYKQVTSSHEESDYLVNLIAEEETLKNEKMKLEAQIAQITKVITKNRYHILSETLKENSKKTIDVDIEIAKIDKEIEKEYKDTDRKKTLSGDNLPRLRFLLEKKSYLTTRKAQYEALLSSTENENAEEKHDANQGGSFFNIGKKLVDILDDAWSAVKDVFRGKFADLFGAILTGLVGFIIHIGEGYEGLKEAYHAIKNEKIPQRKTRIITNVLTFMLAGGGAGLSLAFFASAIGAVVTAATLAWAPVLVPGFLTAIYGLSLWRRSYILQNAKEEDQAAEKNLNLFVETNKEKLTHIDTLLHELHLQKQKYPLSQLEKVNDLMQKNEPLSDEHASIAKLLTQEKELIQLQAQYDVKKQISQTCHLKRLEAEREVAYTALEVTASTIVLVGSVLGTAALLGTASVASFGLLPLGILIVGVVMGVASKLFERADEKNHHAYSQGIRNWWKNLFKPTPKEVGPDIRPEKSPEIVHEKNLAHAKGDEVRIFKGIAPAVRHTPQELAKESRIGLQEADKQPTVADPRANVDQHGQRDEKKLVEDLQDTDTSTDTSTNTPSL